MTPTEQIAQWVRERREIAGKATRGRWINSYPNAGRLTRMPDHVWTEDKLLVAMQLEPEDASHIADAHNSQPKLLAALERAVRQVKDSCYCEDLGYHGSRGPCARCVALSDIASLLGGSP